MKDQKKCAKCEYARKINGAGTMHYCDYNLVFQTLGYKGEEGEPCLLFRQRDGSSRTPEIERHYVSFDKKNFLDV